MQKPSSINVVMKHKAQNNNDSQDRGGDSGEDSYLDVVDEGQTVAEGSGLQHGGSSVTSCRWLEVTELQVSLGLAYIELRLTHNNTHCHTDTK